MTCTSLKSVTTKCMFFGATKCASARRVRATLGSDPTWCILERNIHGGGKLHVERLGNLTSAPLF